MKKLFFSLGLVALVSTSNAASFIADGITYIGIPASTTVYNLDSVAKFGASQPTNTATVQWNMVSSPGIVDYAVSTNGIVGGITNATTFNTVVAYGDGTVSNTLAYNFTKIIGPATNVISIFSGNGTNKVTNYVRPVYNSTRNLLSTVYLQTDNNHSQNLLSPPTIGAAGATNAWGTISMTTLSTGSNTVIATFVPLVNGNYESTDGKDTWTMTVTNASTVGTTVKVIPVLLQGCKAIRLQSLAVAGGAGTPVGILDISLNPSKELPAP